MNLRPILFIIFVLGFCCNAAAESFTDSVRVHFRVNQTVIDTLLMDNDAAMRGFAQRMNDLKDLKDLKVTKDTVIINSILITGAASPEGSIAVNEYLSRERAAAITRWLKSYFEFPDTLPQFVFKGRDWQGLQRMVEADPDVPYKKEVISLLEQIVNTPPSGSYKRDGVVRLKALRDGVPYYYMWKNLFPSLRASEVFIEATVKPVCVVNDLKDLKGSNDFKVLKAAPDSVVISTIELRHHKTGYVFALKTNMLYDVLATPSIGAEFPIGKHFSVGANWMYAWWQNHDRNRHWRIYGGDINARYYFGRTHHGASLQGHHVGVYGQALLFQVANGKQGYISGIPGQDIFGKPWVGGGVEYGYSMRIAKRLNLDFSIGLGYIGGEYRVYRPIDDHYVWQSSHRSNWFGPTKAEISLVWLIGKGVSK